MDIVLYLKMMNKIKTWDDGYSQQRHSYKMNALRRLSSDCIQELNSIGFITEGHRLYRKTFFGSFLESF